MSSYLNQINYNSFLETALQQESQVQSVEDLQSSLFAQAQEAYKSNQTENKDSGIESLFLFAPEATQKFANLVVKGKELYNKLGDLKAQGSKVIEGLKTLPDDLKVRFTDKMSEIETLIKEGSNEAIAKATKSYNSLVDVANKTKASTEGVLTKVSTDATDSVNRAVATTQSITKELSSNLQGKVNSTASKLDSQFKSLKAQGEAVTPELKSKVSDLLTNVQNEAKLKAQQVIADTQAQAEQGAQEARQSLMSRFTPLEETTKTFMPSNYEQLSERARLTKIPVSVKIASDELVNNYKQSTQKVADLESQLRSETNPMRIDKLNTDLNTAKTQVRMNDRLMQLETVDTTTEGASLFSRFGEGLSKAGEIGGNILGVGGTALMTLQEAKGQIKSPVDLAQVSGMQAELGGTIAQKGAQAISKLQGAGEQGIQQGKDVLQEGLTEGKQAVTQVAEQGQKLAGDVGQQIGDAKTALQSTLSEGLEGAKASLSPLSDLAGETIAKGSGLIESIGEKGILETLGEATGIAAIPVVGEVASLGLLATGIYEGIKDIFGGGTKAPTPPSAMAIASPAGLVRQAGI